jgi:hypothetical protein
MRRFGCILASLIVLASSTLASAQSAYPNRPIRILIPYGPGGLTDVVARHYAERLRSLLGQNIIVENKPGASGIIAIEQMARAAPDGYTPRYDDELPAKDLRRIHRLCQEASRRRALRLRRHRRLSTCQHRDPGQARRWA